MGENLYFCDFLDGQCGCENNVGVCVERPILCPVDGGRSNAPQIIGDPVTGCDGKPYDNACQANQAGFDTFDCVNDCVC